MSIRMPINAPFYKNEKVREMKAAFSLQQGVGDTKYVALASTK